MADDKKGSSYVSAASGPIRFVPGTAVRIQPPWQNRKLPCITLETRRRSLGLRMLESPSNPDAPTKS